MRRPAARPCGSCPYRRDAPSGLWHESEYAKLPGFDDPSPDRQVSVFLCHQQDERICAGWAGCHDMTANLGIRIAVSMERLSIEDMEATLTYESPVPLFGSGREAADHGMKDIEEPGPTAVRVRRKLVQRLGRKLT